MKLILLLITLILAVAAPLQAAPLTADQIRLKFQSGQSVRLGIVGNSIGCGYYANNWELINDGIPSTKDNAAIGSWANSLRAFLKTKNTTSDVVNLSEDGWYTKQHNDANTVSKFLTNAPDAVIVPLQINDYCGGGSGRTWTEFTSSSRTLVDTIKSNGMACIIVLENDIGYVSGRSDGKTYSDFIQEANVIATEKGCSLIDQYTFSHAAIVSAGGWAATGLYHDSIHPNQAGHDQLFSRYQSWLNEAVSTGTGSAKHTATIKATFR